MVAAMLEGSWIRTDQLSFLHDAIEKCLKTSSVDIFPTSDLEIT